MKSLFIYNKHTKEFRQFINANYELYKFLAEELGDKFIVSYVVAKEEVENEITEE